VLFNVDIAIFFFRTHRERKELYIKALEQEVLRLKETFSSITRDKDALAEENRKLKELLRQNGITWPGAGAEAPSDYYGSPSGSHATTSQGLSPSLGSTQHPQAPFGAVGGDGRNVAQQPSQPSIDYDQAGIDFVLTYDHPDHRRPYMTPPPQ
jgi:hypothetical protein